MLRTTVIATALAVSSLTASAASEPSTAELLAVIKRLEARITAMERDRAPKANRQAAVPIDIPKSAREAHATVAPVAAPIVQTKWTGPLVGISIGGGKLKGDGDNNLKQNSESQTLYTGPQTLLGLTGDYFTSTSSYQSSGYTDRSNGAVVDVFAGYDWQPSYWLLFGIQAEGSVATLAAEMPTKRKQNYQSIYSGYSDSTSRNTSTETFTTSVETRWMAALLGRAGIVFDDWLLFASGGWAFAEIVSPVERASIGLNGPTFGGGIERRMDGNWRIRGEYRYSRYQPESYLTTTSYQGESVGETSTSTNRSVSDSLTTIRLATHLWRFAFIYQWH
jgi:outer membrane immunogenic protein